MLEQIVRFEKGEELRLGNPTVKSRARRVGLRVPGERSETRDPALVE